MSVLLQIQNISKAYGARSLLSNATASFARNQKIGVIGRNGAGKSTLCRIITGQEEKDSGSIIRNSELRLAFLEQHDSFTLEETAMEFLMRKTDREEWECGMMAGSFHLKDDKLYSPIGALSGGYRTRVKLAAMLLAEPNFLILDEPTNYLDLSTLILLENFLQDFTGGFLIVSHDREFLKKTCEHTLEVENGEVTLFPGNVEEYFTFKEEQRRQIESANKTIEAKRRQLQNFVDRFKAKASKATQAKSKMKQIAKLQTIAVEHDASTVNIRIPAVEAKKGIALYCDDLEVGYPAKSVALCHRLEINRGSKVAILGDNGQGKTTFLRTLANDLTSLSGSARWVGETRIAYYAQHVFQTLNPGEEVLQYLENQAPSGAKKQDILDMAGSFLFQGPDVNKKISYLSGGERARLVLAGMLLRQSPILLLDEPTNHLDFETVEALARALKNFAGTVFIVSHDRTFVNIISTDILEVKKGKVQKYPGTYEEYVYHLEKIALDEESEDEEPEPEKKVVLSKEAEEKIKELNKKIKVSEEKLSGFKKEQESLIQELQNRETFSVEKQKKLHVIENAIKVEEEGWLNLHHERDKLEA